MIIEDSVTLVVIVDAGTDPGTAAAALSLLLNLFSSYFSSRTNWYFFLRFVQMVPIIISLLRESRISVNMLSSFDCQNFFVYISARSECQFESLLLNNFVSTATKLLLRQRWRLKLYRSYMHGSRISGTGRCSITMALWISRIRPRCSRLDWIVNFSRRKKLRYVCVL